MSSRLALDPQGRAVAITTTRSLGLEIGDVFVIVDGGPGRADVDLVAARHQHSALRRS